MIMRGTTPTIRFTFSKVDVSEIEVLYVTAEQGGVILFEKTIDDATMGENYFDVHLSQDDTLAIDAKTKFSIQCRYRLTNGMAGGSKVYEIYGERVLREGVI
jgi:hypothetical protein